MKHSPSWRELVSFPKMSAIRLSAACSWASAWVHCVKKNKMIDKFGLSKGKFIALVKHPVCCMCLGHLIIFLWATTEA